MTNERDLDASILEGVLEKMILLGVE